MSESANTGHHRFENQLDQTVIIVRGTAVIDWPWIRFSLWLQRNRLKQSICSTADTQRSGPRPGSYLSTDADYLGFARNHCILQRISSRLHACGGFPKFECALDADLVLVSLHAVDHATFTGRHRFAVLLDVLGAGAFELGDPGRKLLENRLPEIRLRGNRAYRQNGEQEKQSKLGQQFHCNSHRTSPDDWLRTEQLRRSCRAMREG